MRNERRALWLGLILALLALRAMRAFLSTVSYESLATLKLNGTAFWTLALLAPALAPWSGRRVLRAAIVLAGLASVALSITRFMPAYLPTGAVATGAALFALAHVLRRPGAGAGLALGLAFDGALLLVSDSADPTLGLWGAVAVIPATLLAMVLSLRAQDAEAPRGWLAGVSLGALLVVEVAFLASPFGAARWVDLPPWLVGGAALGGIAVGALLLRGNATLWIVGVFGVLALASDGPWPRLGGLAMAQAAMGAAFVRLAPRAHGVALAGIFAPVAFAFLFFREPFGFAEWSVLVPLLCAIALVGAIKAPSVASKRAPAGVVLVVLLLLVSAWPVAITPAHSAREITIVSYNVHQGFGNRRALDPQLYADILRALDPDIVLLQESDSARISSGGIDIVHFLSASLGMELRHDGADPAILSRFPFVEAPPSTSSWSYEAIVDVEGTRLHLQSVHLGRSSGERALQAEELLSGEGSPRIVAGDFNFFGGLSIPAYQRLMTRYADAWVADGHDRDDPAGNTFSANTLRRRIDLVLVDGVEVLDADRVLTPETLAASDHLPVVVRVHVPTP